MSYGYNVRQPNGYVAKLRTQTNTIEERQQIVRSLTDTWADYCNRNWISANCDDIYSPERKVKAFLGSLSYFLLQDDGEGIVTDYKAMVTGKREIPISSCPSYIEDALYSSVSVPGEYQRENENEVLKSVLEGTAETIKVSKRKAKPLPSRYDRIALLKKNYGIRSLYRSVVDTSGLFECGGTQWQIDMRSYPQYAETKTDGHDTLYGMDQVIYGVDASGVYRFFDMEYTEIFPNKI